ncbi:hypothetical protein NDI37_23240 [Funiculus sociatus GB2-A5]|uniref:Uncharacterized protein n=1 Tax=Funiculus sociatus GB2-A5 TaxID=2933946 RepID=A0ABV0JW73_9CYAN|nr:MULTISPECIES: hypothetical protein [unclassified Trichocoleus]MBD1904576.1 hypothetical protein [Trichocoleus sp. FACHB-832]MBD2060948.1 hypothetical protein [Trichocoleus sp. FACHB-6]
MRIVKGNFPAGAGASSANAHTLRDRIFVYALWRFLSLSVPDCGSLDATNRRGSCQVCSPGVGEKNAIALENFLIAPKINVYIALIVISFSV